MENTRWFVVIPVKDGRFVYIVSGDNIQAVTKLAAKTFGNPVVKELTWAVWSSFIDVRIPPWADPGDSIGGDLMLLNNNHRTVRITML